MLPGGRSPRATAALPAGADRRMEPRRVAGPPRGRIPGRRRARWSGGWHGDRNGSGVADGGFAQGGDRVRPRPAGDSALVLTLQTALVVATGSTLVFLLQFPLANLALCVMFARTARRREPLVAELAAQVVGLRQPSASHPGLNRFFRDATWLWAAIFAASAVALGLALAVEPASVVLVLATAVTVGGVAAGATLSTLWFIRCCAVLACTSASPDPDPVTRSHHPRATRRAPLRAVRRRAPRDHLPALNRAVDAAIAETTAIASSPRSLRYLAAPP